MKPCPFCAEQIQDQAIKCRYCNSMLDGIEIKPLESSQLGAAPTILQPAKILYEGTPSWRAWFGSYCLALLLLCLPLFLVWFGFNGTLSWSWVSGLTVTFAGVSLLWIVLLHLLRRSIRYRITTRTLDTEAGILTKRIQTLQLWRVRDLDSRQSVLERILGIATIHVATKDVSDPDLVLKGLPASRDIFDQLKDAAELARQQRVIGVVE